MGGVVGHHPLGHRRHVRGAARQSVRDFSFREEALFGQDLMLPSSPSPRGTLDVLRRVGARRVVRE